VVLADLRLKVPDDVGIAAVGVDPARGRVRLDPGGRVAGDAAQAIYDVLQLFLLIRLHESGPLERTKLGLDPGRLQIVEHGLRGAAGGGVAPEISGVEAFRVAGLGQKLLGLGRVVRDRRRLPVEVEADGDDAPGDLR